MILLKKILIAGLFICLFFISNATTYAVSNNEYGEFDVDAVAEIGLENRQVASLIDEISTHLDKKQYDKFISLTSGDLNSGFSDLFFGQDSHEYKKDNIGLWNLDKFKMITCKQVPKDQIPVRNVNYSEYMEYTELVTYLAYCDIVAKEDTTDMFSGMNCFLFVFGKDNNDEYKLLQWSQPLINEVQKIDFQLHRELVHTSKDILSTRLNEMVLKENKEKLENCFYSIQAINDPYYCPMPSKIRVKIKSTGKISTVDFYYYLKNVLPNEWTALADPMESLKAGAMAVKMYGWYRCYNHKYFGLGFDVYDTIVDQVYRAGSEHERSTEAINSVGGMAIINTSGLIFETQYNARAQTQHSGYMSQTGANALAKNGYTWFQICDYYYSNSCKSEGNISSFNYYSLWGSKSKLELILKAIFEQRFFRILNLNINHISLQVEIRRQNEMNKCLVSIIEVPCTI